MKKIRPVANGLDLSELNQHFVNMGQDLKRYREEKEVIKSQWSNASNSTLGFSPVRWGINEPDRSIYQR